MAYPLRQPFPRIPLTLRVPDNLPGIKEIASFSVEPTLSSVVYHKEEIEIEGTYRICLNYCGADVDSPMSLNEDERVSSCCFFESLQFLNGGFLEECEERQKPDRNSETGWGYSWSWEDSIHTFVQTDRGNYSSLPLILKVHDCELKAVNERTVKGFLVLMLDARSASEMTAKDTKWQHGNTGPLY